MNRKRVVCALFGFFLSVIPVMAQIDRLTTIIGPRVGATYIFADWTEFNAQLQQVFPDPGRSYNPIITQFGINLEQRILLGSSKSHFVLQEILVLGGLDQNFILPSLSTLIGFRSYSGLEFGLGPNFSLGSSGGKLRLSMSVVYAIGWTFAFNGVFVPVNFAVIPTPKDTHVRLSLMSGFNFETNW
ncbi:MAG: hypothetical protein HN368_21235 [Spirochaetales bacterium]|jgi:hypothetical protein|nr:hypothetical protein [Spirochaetales bacterium]